MLTQVRLAHIIYLIAFIGFGNEGGREVGRIGWTRRGGSSFMNYIDIVTIEKVFYLYRFFSQFLVN